MLENYIKVAIRVFQRDTLYSVINIVGLVIGLIVCVLVILYGRHELSYDKWLPEADLIFRYEVTDNSPGRPAGHYTNTHVVVRDLLAETIDEIPSITRVVEAALVIETPDKRRIPHTVRFVDPNFFDVIDLPLLSGDKSTALSNNNSMLISETMAHSIFGNSDPVGQVVNTNNMRNTNDDFREKRSAENPLMERDYVISGVFKDIPSNSHFVFDIIMPFDLEDSFARYKGVWAFERGKVYTYIKLRSAQQVASIEAQFPAFVDKYLPPSPDQPNVKTSELFQPKLINIQDIHYGSTGLNNIKNPGDIRRLYAAIGIAVLILVIASINFVNLTVAKSTLRSKEVALRKILGASKSQLVTQFLSESLFFAFISLFIAIACLELVIPTFNNFVGMQIIFEPFSDLGLALALVFLTLLMGLLGGLYPALIVSRFRPAKTLRTEQPGTTKGSNALRTGLVIVQFSIAVTLGLVAVTFYQQNAYIANADLGYSPENKLIIDNINEPAFMEYRDAIAKEIRLLPGVKAATLSVQIPTDTFRVSKGGGLSIAGDPTKVLGGGIGMTVDHYFLQAYDIPLLAGRYFSEEFAQDQYRPPVDPKAEIPVSSIILSEASVRSMGFTEIQDAVGQFIEAIQPRGRQRRMEIVGVVADAKIQSLKNIVQPTTYVISPYIFDKLTIAYESDAALPTVLQGIEEIWRRYTPERPLSYVFLEEKIKGVYANERQQSQLIAGSAALAILVACIGLFAISVLVSELRSQEIVIRRVFGASTPSLVKLLITQFSVPIIFANLIAWPLGYYFIRQYLDAYAYRIDISVYVFVGVSLITLIIGWATIGTHILKMVSLRPTESLRYD